METSMAVNELRLIDQLIYLTGQLHGPNRVCDGMLHKLVTPSLRDTTPDEIGWLVGGQHANPTRTPQYTNKLGPAVTLIPLNWFIDAMGEKVTPVLRVGDMHERRGWYCNVQFRLGGGRLREATSRLSLAMAVVTGALLARRAEVLRHG